MFKLKDPPAFQDQQHRTNEARAPLDNGNCSGGFLGHFSQHDTALSLQSSSKKNNPFPHPSKDLFLMVAKMHRLLLKTQTLQESREGEFMAIDLLTQVGL